jgi:hypothetical protein
MNLAVYSFFVCFFEVYFKWINVSTGLSNGLTLMAKL